MPHCAEQRCQHSDDGLRCSSLLLQSVRTAPLCSMLPNNDKWDGGRRLVSCDFRYPALLHVSTTLRCPCWLPLQLCTGGNVRLCGDPHRCRNWCCRPENCPAELRAVFLRSSPKSVYVAPGAFADPKASVDDRCRRPLHAQCHNLVGCLPLLRRLLCVLFASRLFCFPLNGQRPEVHGRRNTSSHACFLNCHGFLPSVDCTPP